MKYLPLTNLLSITLMAYWLLKDCKFKARLRLLNIKIKGFFCPIFERIADDCEIY